jgi:SRSO17 transposase
VRCAVGNVGKARLLPEQWLLIERPANQAKPEKYSLSTLPEGAALNDLVQAAHLFWRIERDYQHLKQELGLGHYEGRAWRGFHHHASLSIAAYGFLMVQRIKAGNVAGVKKKLYRTPNTCRSLQLQPSGQSSAHSITWRTQSQHCAGV